MSQMFDTPGAHTPPMRFTSPIKRALVISADRPTLFASAIGDRFWG